MTVRRVCIWQQPRGNIANYLAEREYVYQGERAERASRWYRGRGLGRDGPNGDVNRQTPPSWMDQSPPNFQGVISTYGRTSSSIWFFKKHKYEKLLFVKLLINIAYHPLQLAELNSLEMD